MKNEMRKKMKQKQGFSQSICLFMTFEAHFNNKNTNEAENKLNKILQK